MLPFLAGTIFSLPETAECPHAHQDFGKEDRPALAFAITEARASAVTGLQSAEGFKSGSYNIHE